MNSEAIELLSCRLLGMVFMSETFLGVRPNFSRSAIDYTGSAQLNYDVMFRAPPAAAADDDGDDDVDNDNDTTAVIIPGQCALQSTKVGVSKFGTV